MQLQQPCRGGGSSTDSNSPVIQFKDQNLKKALLEEMKRQRIIKEDATEITKAQAEEVHYLGGYRPGEPGNDPLYGKGITDITGLQYFTSLKILDLFYNDITSLSPLVGLSNLKDLRLNSKKITDFTPLASLKGLKHLSCSNTNISDLSPLTGLKKLQYLWLDNSQISNISPLKDLSNLYNVRLSHSQITDFSPLKGLSKLEDLDLSYNQITDISPLNDIPKLGTVDLSHNQITDFSSINNKSIFALYLNGNPITSLEPISKLTQGSTVSLQSMKITHKVSASTIDLSTLWPYAKYCIFSFSKMDPLPIFDPHPEVRSSVGTICNEKKTFTLNELPVGKKKVTLHFMMPKKDRTNFLKSLGVKDADGYGWVLYEGELILDYSSEEEPQVGPLYRLYNPYTHEHFFTAETTENDNLVRLGWKSEGGVGYIYKHAEKGGVYRLYNPSTGEHHYTMNEDEVATCVKAGWKNEGVKWFSAQDKEVTLNKLYSMYNPYEKKFYHHYTADAKEIEQMVKAGWRKEEVKWCTLPVSYIIKK